MDGNPHAVTASRIHSAGAGVSAPQLLEKFFFLPSLSGMTAMTKEGLELDCHRTGDDAFREPFVPLLALPEKILIADKL
jgi:hypothetical protein